MTSLKEQKKDRQKVVNRKDEYKCWIPALTLYGYEGSIHIETIHITTFNTLTYIWKSNLLALSLDV